MANNTKIDLDKQVLSLGEGFEALWENINEKFARKTDNTIPTRTVFAYKTSTSQPGKPMGGSWNNKTNEVVYPRNNPDDLDQEHVWGGADNIERPIWMSVKTFAAEPAAESDWSLPTMISGENGAPGADGLSREFVYKLTKTEFEVPGGEDPNYAENLPSEQVNGFVPDGWRDRPTGISEEYRAEWQLTRTKQEDGTWGKWSGPSLWSKYGVNGQDGDSVEYIYMRTKTTEELDGIKVTTPPVIPGYNVDSDEYQGIGAYYGKEYVPDGWSDNPVDVDDEWMWCWVSQRKKKNNKWQAFSEPTLWAKYGETGKSGYTVRNLYYTGPENFDEMANLLESINAQTPPDPTAAGFSANIMPAEVDTYNVWGITAVWDVINNKLAEGEMWTGPFLVSSALAMSRPNFQITAYAPCLYDEYGNEMRPLAPTGGINYDETFGVDGLGTLVVTQGSYETIWGLTITDDNKHNYTWYMCNGQVNGISRVVTWSAMNRYTPLDGNAKPGMYTEYRYAASEHPDIVPSTSDLYVDGLPVWDPAGWTLTDPVSEGHEIKVEVVDRAEAVAASYELESGDLIKVLSNSQGVGTDGNTINYPAGLYQVINHGRVEKFIQYIWQIWGIKKPKSDTEPDSFSMGWQGPIRLSGEPGESIMGDVGPSGVPGANFSPLYAIGNSDGPILDWDHETMKNLDESSLIGMGWDQAPPKVTAQYPYVWCIQAKLVWEYDENNVMVQKVGPDGWCEPFRMSGLNVMDQPGAITLYAVLDNPADTVICDSNGNVPQSNLGIKTTFKVYKGTSEKYVKSLVLKEEVDGVEYRIEGATLIVDRITSTKDKIYIPLIATVDDLGQELSYESVFSISKLYAGAPTIVTDFGNENITVPATTDGVLEDSAYPIETSIHVYLGTTEINVFNVKCDQLSNDGYSVEDGVLSISRIPNFTGDVALLDFDITFTVEGKEYTKTSQLRVVKVKQGRDSVIYELSANTNAIRRTQDNQIVPTTLDVVVLRKTGDGEVTTLDMNQIQSFGKVVYSIDNENYNDFPMSGSLDLTNPELDLEQHIELKLIDIQDQTIYLDKETLYLLHDGLPAVQYSLVVNRDVVQYDEKGNATDRSSIVCDLIKVDGSNYEKQIGVPTGYDLEYSIDGNLPKKYTPGFSIAYNGFERIVEFKLYAIVDGEPVLVDYDKVVVMKPAQGERGRIIYPAGIYDKTKTYITDREKAPYVLDTSDNKFYVLAKETSWNGEMNNGATPQQNAETDNPVWEAFEMFEAVYAQIGVFNQALVGSAVFFGEYVFSQSGRTANDKPSTNYELFNPDDPYGTPKGEGFYPSICFDFVSGAFWLGGNRISYDPVENAINLKGVKMRWEDIQDLPEDFEKLATTAGQSATQAEKHARDAAEQAQLTNDRVDRWADDGIVSPTEQNALLQKKSEISAEYNRVLSDITAYNNSIVLAGDYTVDIASLTTAYDNACSAINYHTDKANAIDGENIPIKDGETDGVIKYSNIAAYYAALVAVTDEFAKKSANYAEALANAYTDGEIDGILGQTQESINEALEAAKEYAETVVENNKQTIVDAAVAESQKNINAAKKDLIDELNEKAKALQKAIDDGDAAAIAQANAALEKANDAADALGDLETAVNNIKDGLDDMTVLSEGDVTNLSIAAIQTATEITGDTVASQTLIGRNIIGLAGTFAKIQAENIEGTTISGLNVQSANKIGNGDDDPTWKIMNQGDGYLAKKNISWNTAGDLTVKGKINGSVGSTMGPWQTFDSGSVKYIADASTYDAAKNAFGSDGSFKLGGSQGIVKSGNNITFGDDVVLEWSGDGGDSDVTDAEFKSLMNTWLGSNTISSDKISGSFDISKITGEISGTRITKGTITSDLIAANAIGAEQIAAGAITADKITGNEAQFKTLTAEVLKVGRVDIEKIVTEKIAAQEISTNKLNTNIDNIAGAGKIIIEGNTITALNNKMDQEVLVVTGTQLGDVPEELYGYTGAADMYFNTGSSDMVDDHAVLTQTSGNIWSAWETIPIEIEGTPIGSQWAKKPLVGYTYDISLPYDFQAGITIPLFGNSASSSPSLSIRYIITDDPNPPTSPDFCDELFAVGDVMVSGNSSLNWNSDCSAEYSLNTINGVPDYLYMHIISNFKWDGNTGNGECFASFTITPKQFSMRPRINRTDVSNSGFRSIINANQYLIVNSTNIKARTGNFVFTMDSSNGIRVSKDGGSNWTSLTQ